MLGIAMSVASDLRQTWRRMFVIDLACKPAAFAVFWPMVGLALRGSIARSGSSAIADEDIVFAVLSPLGLLPVIVLSALGLAVLNRHA